MKGESAPIGELDGEQLIVMLPEAIIAAAYGIPGHRPAERHLAAKIVGGPIIRSVRREVAWIAGVIGAIVMKKWRHRQERIGTEGSDPGKVHKCVSLVFAIILEDAWGTGRW